MPLSNLLYTPKSLPKKFRFLLLATLIFFTLSLLSSLVSTKTLAAVSCTAFTSSAVEPGDSFQLTVSFSEGDGRAFVVRYNGTNNVTNTISPDSNPYTVSLKAPDANFNSISVASAPRTQIFSCAVNIGSSAPTPPPPPPGNSGNSGDGGQNNSQNAGSGSESDASVVQTALGTISTDPKQLVNTLLTIAIGIAGGIAFLLIVYGGFRLAFSQGDPKAVQEARDIITSAIVGLLLIVFSVFLLNLIGVDILGLPIGD